MSWKYTEGVERMNKTKIPPGDSEKILVDTEELRRMLGAGKASAVDIGTAAGARVQQGRRVLWNVQKIRDYINAVSE